MLGRGDGRRAGGRPGSGRGRPARKRPAADEGAETPAEGTSVDVLTWSNAATVQYLKDISAAFHEANPDHYLTISEVPSAEIDQVIRPASPRRTWTSSPSRPSSKPQEDWNADSIDKPAWQQYIDEGLLLDLTDQPFIDNYNLDILMGNSYKDRLYSLNMGTVAYQRACSTTRRSSPSWAWRSPRPGMSSSRSARPSRPTGATPCSPRARRTSGR